MSINTKFSPLGYLYPKTPQVQVTINVNISVDNIYLNGISIAQNTNTITVNVNQGLICNVKVEEQDYGTVNLQQFICYNDTIKDVYMSAETTETLYLSINSGEEAEFIIPLNQYRPVAYNWNIDWGDDIIETRSGVGAFNTGIVHQYPNKNTLYTIKIKRNEQTNYDEWLLAFGFDDETTNIYGPSSQTNNTSNAPVAARYLEREIIDSRSIKRMQQAQALVSTVLVCILIVETMLCVNFHLIQMEVLRK